MKRIILLVVTFALVLSSAYSEDYSAMTDEQLQTIINSARSELYNRYSNREYLVNDEYVRIYKTGEGKAGTYEYDGFPKSFVQMEVIVENVSGQAFELITDKVSINGWETDPVIDSSGEIGAGMKKKCYIEMIYTDADLSSPQEMKDIVIHLHIGDLFTRIKEYTINMVLNLNEG